jgi:hypothetical protein
MDAVRSFKARMVALASADAKTTWDQLEVFMTQWREIERCLQFGAASTLTDLLLTARPGG